MMYSIHYDKTGKMIQTPLINKLPFHYLHSSSTTHTNNTNNTENNDIITPSPPTSHETNTTCTNHVMTDKYVAIGASLHHHHPYQNTNNTENNITLPPTSHETDSICTNQVMNNPKYHPHHPLYNDCPNG